jgi:hypothetical protein
VSGPKFAAPVARSATAEAGTKPNMTDPTFEQETLQAFAVAEDFSDQVVRFGVGARPRNRSGLLPSRCSA